MNMMDFLEEITEDQKFFQSAIDLVPPHFYFDRDSIKLLQKKVVTSDDSDSEEDDELMHDHTQFGKSNGEKKNKKTISDDKPKSKRAKLGPTVTVTELQAQINDKEVQLREASRNKKKKKHNVVKSTNDNLEDLRNKLESRIQQLREKRKWTNTETLQKKIERRKEKRLKSKAKTKNKELKSGSLVNGSASKTNDINIGVKSKPIYNKEGKMVFSKFDFKESGKKKNKREETGQKKYQKLLLDLERKKKKMTELREKDEEGAKIAEEKASWKSALQRAEGVKVKDNPDLIKKTIKRKEKMKKKSRKEWEERSNKLQEKMKDREDKRKKNLQSRRKAKIDKKINRAKKKGRIIPGF